MSNPNIQGTTTTTVTNGESNISSAAPVVSSSDPSSSSISSSSTVPLPTSSNSAFKPAIPSLKKKKQVNIWELNSSDIQIWLKDSHPLFPKPVKPVDPKDVTDEYERQRLDETRHKKFENDVTIANLMLQHLIQALNSASVDPSKTSQEHAVKRMKLETSSNERDEYKILDPSFSKGTDIVHVPGAIIARLTIGGLMNAFAGVKGGICHAVNAVLLPQYKKDTKIASCHNCTIAEIQSMAVGVSHIISARLEIDMMTSTPRRITEMLCPELSIQEVKNIRKRIYDTVIKGKGTGGSALAAMYERNDDVPIAAKTQTHDIDKFKKCKVCGNDNQGSFVHDRKNGDSICSICGTVAAESLMHEGTQFRKFEGEEDRNHHGDAPNKLYSDSYNMGTSLGGVSMSVGAGRGGFGSGGKNNLENVLKNIHAYTEMNISQFGKDEKKTRIGYKDRQKKEAFVQMTHVADALSLHQAVLQLAKELFAGFRDDRELVQQFKGVLAACLCEAFDQLSQDGKQILKVKAAEDKNEEQVTQQAQLNSRANRRTELHSSSLAGKGGLFLNTEKPVEVEGVAKKREIPVMNETEKKPAATWTLEDIRSWLLEVSKVIAKQWVDLQKEESKPGSKIKPGSVPKGSQSDLEGMLVQHTLTLCGALETELTRGTSSMNNRKRVVTPRVHEMGTLGIKWQHKHERGSGGAGGVANNAMQGKHPKAGNQKTAGQILILKTSKKLSQILNDPLSGEAFHKELRSLISRQEALKKKELRDTASMQRLNQMKRKPWLQARVGSG